MNAFCFLSGEKGRFLKLCIQIKQCKWCGTSLSHIFLDRVKSCKSQELHNIMEITICILLQHRLKQIIIVFTSFHQNCLIRTVVIITVKHIFSS